ncbi:type VII secretion-associated serine protease mycosin [Nocardia yunnanensis]|nr:type VII secretion-associated serine protease mycosin [Nocardia yunnanensis]
MVAAVPPTPGDVPKETTDLADRPAPPSPTELKVECGSEFGLKPGGVPRDEPLSQKVLDLPSAWQANTTATNRGAGQTIAVIDTGVSRHPRIDVQPGGDYVSGSDGTEDCDGHGTVVAGIIAAKPSADDALVGVAPDATILSIRQLSERYQAKDQNGGEKAPGSMSKQGYGPSSTLAAAVVRAVNLKAAIINISAAACTSADSSTGDDALGAAVRYAYERGVVVIAAAGNVDSGNGCNVQNTEQSNPAASWKSLSTIASPAWFSPYVLSVGWIGPDGTPSERSLHGPWVGVAAIGQDVLGFDSKTGGMVNTQGYDDKNKKWVGIQGTSFAAPYVAGLAALVRADHPEWDADPGTRARKIMNQIILTAHQPGTGRDDRVGAGMIDPVAALTTHFSDDVLTSVSPVLPNHTGSDTPVAFPTPQKPAGPPHLPRLVATIGTIVCLSALGIGLAVSIPFRRRRRDDELPDFD